MDFSSQYQHQAYNSSEAQTYGPSSQAFHEFHQYNRYKQRQHYSYYPQDYSNIYQQQQSQQEPISIHPPGVPMGSEPANPMSSDRGLGQTHVQNQQYEAMAAVAGYSGFGPVVIPGGQHQPIGQTPYSEGRRRVGGKFRGRGPGPSFRGRGRGRGRGGCFPTRAENSKAFMQAEPPQAPGGPGQVQFPNPATNGNMAVWPPPPMAWCELCRVDCNTPEILEQHKNGKKHKKNLKVHEELQKLNKIMVEGQIEEMPGLAVNHDIPPQPQNVEVLLQEDLPPKAVTEENKMEAVKREPPDAGPPRKPGDHVEAQERGSKRKMRGGRGGKWIRTHEGSRRQVKPPKPKESIPLMCELCNVKCESQVVFQSHLAGKKHLSNIKRFQDQQALLGQAAVQVLLPALQTLYPALQALCPPNPNASTSNASQFQPNFDGSQDPLTQQAPLFLPSQAPGPGHGHQDLKYEALEASVETWDET